MSETEARARHSNILRLLRPTAIAIACWLILVVSDRALLQLSKEHTPIYVFLWLWGLAGIFCYDAVRVIAALFRRNVSSAVSYALGCLVLIIGLLEQTVVSDAVDDLFEFYGFHGFSMPRSASTGAAGREYIVAAAWDGHRLDLTNLECVAIRHVYLFGKPYTSDANMEAKVKELIAKNLTSAVGSEETSDSPFIFYSGTLTGKTKAVRLYAKAARVLIAFGVCKKKPDGTASYGSCFSKNVYVFQDDLLPIELFEVGFTAFIRKQDDEWEAMTIRLGADMK